MSEELSERIQPATLGNPAPRPAQRQRAKRLLKHFTGSLIASVVVLSIVAVVGVTYTSAASRHKTPSPSAVSSAENKVAKAIASLENAAGKAEVKFVDRMNQVTLKTTLKEVHADAKTFLAAWKPYVEKVSRVVGELSAILPGSSETVSKDLNKTIRPLMALAKTSSFAGERWDYKHFNEAMASIVS